MRAHRVLLAAVLALTLALRTASAQRSVMPRSTIRYSEHATACGDGLWGRDALRFNLQQLMVSTDSSAIAERRRERLPLVAPDSIRIVTDERICERAAREYYRYRLGPRPLDGVAVAEVGDLYVVFGVERVGEWSVLEVYTRDFERVVRLLV